MHPLRHKKNDGPPFETCHFPKYINDLVRNIKISALCQSGISPLSLPKISGITFENPLIL